MEEQELLLQNSVLFEIENVHVSVSRCVLHEYELQQYTLGCVTRDINLGGTVGVELQAGRLA